MLVSLPRLVVEEVTPRDMACIMDGWRFALDLCIGIRDRDGNAYSYWLEVVGGVPRYVRRDQTEKVIDSKAVEVTEEGRTCVIFADGSRLAIGSAEPADSDDDDAFLEVDDDDVFGDGIEQGPNDSDSGSE